MNTVEALEVSVLLYYHITDQIFYFIIYFYHFIIFLIEQWQGRRGKKVFGIFVCIYIYVSFVYTFYYLHVFYTSYFYYY